jgi:hypothetical protein
VSLAGASEYKSGAKGAWEGGLIIRGLVTAGAKKSDPAVAGEDAWSGTTGR